MDFISMYRPKQLHPRWHLRLGKPDELGFFAASEWAAAIQSLVNYLIPVESNSAIEFLPTDEDHYLLLGTPTDHPLIAKLAEQGKLQIPDDCEGFSWWIGSHPDHSELKIIAIGSRSYAGCLYGVETFNTEIIGNQAARDLESERQSVLETLSEETHTETPVIAERGIWSWGLSIYDYRSFLDNMARLRMNTLILWNDEPPLNYHELAAAAKARNISLIPGFHWGWGNQVKLGEPGVAEYVEAHVLNELHHTYWAIKPDRLYFQTLTEVPYTRDGQYCMAELAVTLVNQVAQAVWREYPELKLFFGIHAISVEEHYRYFENLDPRISIVWEDAGVIPYCIDPVADFKESHRGWRPSIDTPAKTIAYSKQLAALRNHQEFCIVAKGFPNLIWEEFENHQSYLIGARLPRQISNRLLDRRSSWERSERLWRKNFPVALQFYRELFSPAKPHAMVTLLIEEAMLEAEIRNSAAMTAAILWNPERPQEAYTIYSDNSYLSQFKKY